MGIEENFPSMKIDKMFYFRQLEYSCDFFFTQTVHVRCPRQIVVNYYSQHSMVLYLLNGDALYSQWVEIRHFILPFLSSGNEHEFCFVWM